MIESKAMAYVNMFGVLGALENLCVMDKPAKKILAGLKNPVSLCFSVKGGPCATFHFTASGCRMAEGDESCTCKMVFPGPEAFNALIDKSKPGIPTKNPVQVLSFLMGPFTALTNRLTELLRQCAHPGGAAICGAMLYYPDETLQHAGVVTGLGGYAGHSHKYKKAGGSGYLFRAATVQDFSAVTGACLLVRASVWDEVKGLDEKFAVAFNDVDFCLRVRDKGYRIVWTPYAQLTHYESKSRGGDEKDPVKAARFAAEQQRLYDVHGKADILDDPYYNPSLTHDREDFSESGDLRNLKEGKVTVRWRNA